ncbi:kinesin, putative [Ixodes scapularis]|uniref:Kinesin-like protein n=1 Tax=Ixodes scapularis TaxID=6945 RepID=B7Q2M6_IXOSC|nr:kinesin, putative [Ixodes scapularis]|eukprot:XP_002410906.1 kinesin, putative [Ixodes scapularis]
MIGNRLALCYIVFLQARSAKSESVKVVVRCRPMSEREIGDGYERIVGLCPESGVVTIRNPKSSDVEALKQYTFDAVYDWNSKQMDLYDETFRPLVDSVLLGFNGTIFAYGQTGTGKTYTMEGIFNDPENRGVIPNSFEHIFSHIARSQNQQYLVRASYLEIYQEEIKDLIAKDQTKRLELKERPDTGVYVKDLSSFVCKSIKEIEHVMTVGNQNRSVGATNMNVHSSRSHAIFIITVEHSDLGPDGKHHIRVGKLNLVDLAGSERQVKTGTSGDRQKEAIKINLSLSALGNVISALVDGKSSHVPYRDSKLTRLLQDSLGGNAKTIMIANIGPASYNYEETLTTLRYANRAKNIKNKPRVNEDPKDALLREFQQEISRLKAQLAARDTKKKKKRPSKEMSSPGTEDGNEDEFDEELSSASLAHTLEEERAAIMNDHSLIAEEKAKLLGEVQKRQEQLLREQEAADKLSLKVRAMESKLLSGGKNIVDHTNEQQRALEQRRQEIAEQKVRSLLRTEASVAADKEHIVFVRIWQFLVQVWKCISSLVLFAKLQSVKTEIQDLQEEHSKERRELEQTQNELTRELKLKYLIIENFIPPEDKVKILSRVVYDEDEDQWALLPLSEVPGYVFLSHPRLHINGGVFLMKQHVVPTHVCQCLKAQDEDILRVELDMPVRTTRDYNAPAVSPLLKAVLDDALQEEEEDLDIDAR